MSPGRRSRRPDPGPGSRPRSRKASPPASAGSRQEDPAPVVRSPGMAEPRASFFSLTPDRVLDAVEVGGLRCTGRCLPLRAFENRVYEVELEDERRLVVKFYRPGRWSRETILDEHAFLADLAASEVPAAAPLDLGTGSTLGESDGIYYAAFPKVRGRWLDELDAENRRRIGRTIGRMHAVGAARPAPHRRRLDVATYLREPVEVLMRGDFIPGTLAARYRDVALRIADAVERPLAATRAQRIHGDLHWGNILWASDGPVLVDFDDCLDGPARPGPLAARPRRHGRGAPRPRGPAGGLRGVPRVRPRRPSRSASRCAPCASSTCRAGSPAAGTTPPFPTRSRTSRTTATGCRSTRRWSASARPSADALRRTRPRTATREESRSTQGQLTRASIRLLMGCREVGRAVPHVRYVRKAPP